MKHSFIDRYSELNSPIHLLDPRVKIISIFLYILFVVTTPPSSFFPFGLYFGIIFPVILVSCVPIAYIFKRILIIIPFVLLTGLFIFKNPLLFWNVLIKSFLCILAITLLSSTTKFPLLLKGLEGLGFPKISIILLSFMYRYIFVLVDEALAMDRARNVRYFGGSSIGQIKVLGNIIAVLFIRSYERGERVYQAMVARGFTGEIKTLNRLKFCNKDILFLVGFLSLLVLIKWSL